MKKGFGILLALPILAQGFLCASRLSAGEIGFIEEYSLSQNREEAIGKLIPGTEDYFYYKCLNLQTQGRLDEVETELKKWIGKFNYTSKVNMIRNRQALLIYTKDPARSLAYLTDILGLQFQHQKELVQEKAAENFPTTLDQNLISFETLKKRALTTFRSTVTGFTREGLDHLGEAELKDMVRRDFLSRLDRPDFPGLPALVVADLKYRDSRGFGSLPIHGLLLLDQLDECLRLMPELRNQTQFVNTYVSKLRPADGVNFLLEPAEEQAYFQRLWNFAKNLAPVHNSLKSNILFSMLSSGRKKGVYDKELFLEYIKIPRQVFYISENYLRKFSADPSSFARSDSNFQQIMLLPPVCDDSVLVNDFLQRFLKDAENWNEFTEYIRDTVLKRNFAEAKILNGIGDQEQWNALLSPAEYQALKDRVDIEFSPTNREFFSPADEVSLSVFVKNVEKLYVKIYRINLFNYYKENKREPGIDIGLDGLVPNEENAYEYKDLPLRRIERNFDLPSLKDRGVYIVEMIGNGKVSRAIVRKGKFKYSTRATASGQAFEVYWENGVKAQDASIWMDGHSYDSDKDGTIMLPYTTSPGEQKIIISAGGFSSLDSFQHQPEEYSLRAGFHVARESLIKGKTAKVLVRPVLYVGDRPVSLDILENTRLKISTIDLEEVPTSKIVDDFKIETGKEAEYTFKVPANICGISFSLQAKTRSMSKSQDIELSSETGVFCINQIDHSKIISELLMGKSDAGYHFSLVDKSGRALPGRPVTVVLHNRFFTNTVTVNLKTDPEGMVRLGQLKDISHMEATLADGMPYQFVPSRDIAAIPGYICAAEGDTVSIPYMAAVQPKEAAPKGFSLLEERQGIFVKDWSDKAAPAGGLLKIAGLPRGEYSLRIRDGSELVHISVCKGKKAGGNIVSELRVSELSNLDPLQIESLAAADGKLAVKLLNAGDSCRVHIFADIYNFGTSWSPFADFSEKTPFPAPSVQVWPLFTSGNQSGRAIGDEYEYILSRRKTAKFPGNMLERPGLLLNPFALRETVTEAPPEARQREEFEADKLETAAGAMQLKSDGKMLARKGAPAPATMAPGAPQKSKNAEAEYWKKQYKIAMGEEEEPEGTRRFDFFGGRGPSKEDPSTIVNLDFLAESSPVFANLAPGKDGKIEIPLDKLGGRQDILVVALDSRGTVMRSISLPASKPRMDDVRLAKSFDLQKHFVETKKITALQKGGKLVIGDILTSSYNVYDRVSKVYSLYNTLAPSPELAEFSFVSNWAALDEKTKMEKYSKYACHELNYFIYRKDRPFFDKVVIQYIRNKKDKTFLDKWLAGEDVGEYISQWLYRDRLNALEKILLAGKLGDQDPTRRFILEQFELIPPDPARYNYLFDTALQSSALEAGKPGVPAEYGYGVGIGADEGGEERRITLMADLPTEMDLAGSAKPAEERKKEMNGAKSKESLAKDRATMEKVQQLYRKLDQTKELAENNYYKLPILAQDSSLVSVNAFWNDLAAKNAADDFLSTNLAEASGNFTETMLALASLNLPFAPENYREDLDGRALTITAASPMIVFHKEISEAEAEKEKTPLMTGQRYFLDSERFTYDGNRIIDKYVSGEFLVNNVYGCCIFVTNPTSAPIETDVLLQIPQGAIPVRKGFYTKSFHWNLGPFETQRLEYLFYFPETGEFTHYPAQISINEKFVVATEAGKMKVVRELSTKDTKSWNYISQNGTDQEVLDFIAGNNVNRLDLEKIAFRMRDKAFFEKAYGLLDKIHAYNDTIWSYGILHNSVPAIREYLRKTPVAQNCGKFIESEILSLDPVSSRTYQFLEYSPFVNARTCLFGPRRSIFNEALLAQYDNLLDCLSFKKELGSEDLMAVTYYMLLQDRVEEAMKFYGRIDSAKVAEKVQYDYLTGYVALYRQEAAKAAEIATKYADYPVPSWRNRFLEIGNQIAEAKGEKAKVVDQDNREMLMTSLAAQETTLDFEIESGSINLTFANLAECTVNFYLMDIEFLFSASPFAKDYGKQFSYIFPNRSDKVELPKDGKFVTIKIPADFLKRNVLVEIRGGGKSATRPYYANSMDVRIEENYGQLKVTDRETGRCVPAAYVKVYARMRDGSVAYYKDGYTDLRGRFDYTSLNTDEITMTEKFSILIMSDKNGSVVKEANPPKR